MSRYGQDGPCTLLEADEDDSDRYPNGTLRDLGARLREFAYDDATPDHHSRAMGDAFRELAVLREKVARVEALADDGWWSEGLGVWVVRAPDLRAALADPAPVVQHDDEAKCPTCGKRRGEARTMVRHAEGFGLCPESFHFRDPVVQHDDATDGGA